MTTSEDMEHEFDLPPLPHSQQKDPSLELSDIHHKRKRPRLEHDITTSSDPALFSSDDHAPTAENYVSSRRKEQWRGTWWGEKVKSHGSSISDGGKRKFRRNYDSGVWMGSEGADTSLEDGLLEALKSTDDPSTTWNPFSHENEGIHSGLGKEAAVMNNVGKQARQQPQYLQITQGTARNASLNAAAENIIDRCLEAGDENIDLSSLSLDRVPNEILRRLRGLTKHTTIQDIPPRQNTYSPIEPALRLYLSNNAITSLPSEILNLTNLRVLSVRHNKLTNLPPAIATLPHLEQLNIAGNKLRYLPYEMLRLYDRAHFEMIASPNPFEDPPPAQTNPQSDPGALLMLQPRLLARSTRQYFHANGSGIPETATASAISSSSSSRVPSLLEVALRNFKDLPHVADVAEWSANGEGPASLMAPLAFAEEAIAYGNLECTICGRRFIVPRVQWTEWWWLPVEKKDGRVKFADPWIFPLQRRSCSWGCVEEAKL